ncbi:MAG: DUF3857 domain-containing protein [Bacteroidia bacterium]|nr:DUF3857 domain-containing protein [Bacteroidia bacterium]MDW8157912.1 DUF3857 domain-containing protein [Bacteroidia bacterium]
MEALQRKYPHHDIVVLKASTEVNFQLQNEKLIVIAQKKYEKLLIKQPPHGLLAREYIVSSEFEAIKNIKAQTVIFENHKEKNVTVNPNNIITKDLTLRNIFHSGTKLTQILFPAVKVGAKLQLSYTQEFLEPFLIPRFEIVDKEPVLNFELKVTVPANVRIRYDILSKEDSIKQKIKLIVRQEKENTIYLWQAKELSYPTPEPDAPPAYNIGPHIYLTVQEYQTPLQTYSVLGTLQDLYRWCKEMANKQKTTYTPEMKLLVDSLTRNSTTSEEKARKIFEWVQQNIQYIALEYGYEGYIPRAAELVLARRFGDCKDMSNLLVHLFKLANLQAHLSWVGTRQIDFSPQEIPLPFAFNHMIATWIDEKGNYLFLDPTGRFQPLGIPTDHIQGKEAIIENGEQFILKTVPIMPKEFSIHKDSCVLQVQNSLLQGQGRLQLSGYFKIEARYPLLTPSPLAQKNYIRAKSSKGNNKYTLLNYQIKGLDNSTAPLYIDYEFQLPNYIYTTENKKYINPHLVKPDFLQTIDNNRIFPIAHDYKKILSYQFQLPIPTGYKLISLPEPQKFEHPAFGFHTNYHFTADQVVISIEFYIDALLIKKEDFSAWNTMIQTCNKAFSQNIVFEIF